MVLNLAWEQKAERTDAERFLYSDPKTLLPNSTCIPHFMRKIFDQKNVPFRFQEVYELSHFQVIVIENVLEDFQSNLFSICYCVILTFFANRHITLNARYPVRSSEPGSVEPV